MKTKEPLYWRWIRDGGKTWNVDRKLPSFYIDHQGETRHGDIPECWDFNQEAILLSFRPAGNGIRAKAYDLSQHEYFKCFMVLCILTQAWLLFVKVSSIRNPASRHVAVPTDCDIRTHVGFMHWHLHLFCSSGDLTVTVSRIPFTFPLLSMCFLRLKLSSNGLVWLFGGCWRAIEISMTYSIVL